MPYEIIGRSIVGGDWTGTRTLLPRTDDGVAMPQTPNGSMILGYWNVSAGNNDGTLALTSGGSQPVSLDVPALAQQPSLLVGNWHADNLNLTNVSANDETPIYVQAFGPGLPGNPVPLTVGTPLVLGRMQTATGQAKPGYMQFALTNAGPDLTIVALVGGPRDKSDNNAYVFAVNFPDSGDATGYTKVTSSNSLTFQFNWGSSGLYVANMSPGTAAPATVLVRSL